MKYLVTERQVVVYTWEVDTDELDNPEDPDELYNALHAIDGVPDNANSNLVQSETIHEEIR